MQILHLKCFFACFNANPALQLHTSIIHEQKKPFKCYVGKTISNIGFEGFARRFCFEAIGQPQSCPVTLTLIGMLPLASCAGPVAGPAASGPRCVPSGPRPQSPQSEGPLGWLPLPTTRCLRRKAQLVAFAAVVFVDSFLLASNWPRAIRRPRQEFFPATPSALPLRLSGWAVQDWPRSAPEWGSVICQWFCTFPPSTPPTCHIPPPLLMH